jgi:hypothetical protein
LTPHTREVDQKRSRVARIWVSGLRKWDDDVCEASIPELGLKTEVANGKALLAVEVLRKEAEADKAAGAAV